MIDVLDYAPVAATVLAIPQFLPQIRKLRATGDAAGVSWSWATLTSVNNAAWIGYFALARYWSALVPSSAATLLAGMLAMMLARRGRADARSAALISAWAALLATTAIVVGHAGLGALLTAAFVVQVAPASGPLTGRLIPPASLRRPGCSSWENSSAGCSTARTSPTRGWPFSARWE